MRNRSRASSPETGGRESAARGRGRLASVPPERHTEDERVERDVAALTMQRRRAAANHLHKLVPYPRCLHGPGVAFVFEREDIDRLHEIVVKGEDGNVGRLLGGARIGGQAAVAERAHDDMADGIGKHLAGAVAPTDAPPIWRGAPGAAPRR